MALADAASSGPAFGAAALAVMLSDLHKRLAAATEAPAVALGFVRHYVPAKFLFVLRYGRSGRLPECRSASLQWADGDRQKEVEDWTSAEGFLADVATSERQLIAGLRKARARGMPPRHSYCGQSWMAAVVADCVGHLSAALNATALGPSASVDFFSLKPDSQGCGAYLGVTPAQLGGALDAWSHNAAGLGEITDAWVGQSRPLEIQPLLEQMEGDENNWRCLSEDYLFGVACGLSRLAEANLQRVRGLDLRQELAHGAAFFEDAALRLLLCDGCRIDGRGLNSVPLDEIMWTLGLFRAAASLIFDDASAAELHSSALKCFRSQPAAWWRGDGEMDELESRTRGCPSAHRGLCAGWGKLWASELTMPVAKGGDSFGLPPCQLDREPLDVSKVEVLKARDVESCSWRDPSVIGLFLPINLRSLNSLVHLTDAFTWLFPALAWSFGGELVKRLLVSLWRSAGLHGPAPERLEPGRVEAILVFHPSLEEEEAQADAGSRKVRSLAQSTVRELLPLLSSRGVWTLDELQAECRCYSTAIWGYVEPSLRMHGDLGSSFTGRLRVALGTYFGVPIGANSARAWSSSAVARSLVGNGFVVRPASPDEEASSLKLERVNLLFAYRSPERHKTRVMTNRAELSSALASLVDGTPPLRMVEGSLERLPLPDQVRLALNHVDIMVQPFGAGLAWSLLLPTGSYVIELQEDGIASANFVSCFSHRWAYNAMEDANPWWPPMNARSEWGAWAFMNGVNFACVSWRPTPAHCRRQLYPSAWDHDALTVDVTAVVRLVIDASRRLRAGLHTRTSREYCCDLTQVPRGNDWCWDKTHNYTTCCRSLRQRQPPPRRNS